MGGYIQVDHSQITSAVSQLREYISMCELKLASADNEVAMSEEFWKGEDAAKFRVQWRAFIDEGASQKQFIESLSNYAIFLESASNQYKQAQIDAINRASRLPRW